MRDVSFFAAELTLGVTGTERTDAGCTEPGAAEGTVLDVLITVGFGNWTGMTGFSLIVSGLMALVALGTGVAGLAPCLRKFNFGGRGSPSFCSASSTIFQLLHDLIVGYRCFN